MKFHQKLLMVSAAAMCFGASTIKAPIDPFDNAGLKAALKDGTRKEGEVVELRVFVPLDTIRVYKHENQIFAGQSGNPDNLGLFKGEGKIPSQKIAGPIENAKAFTRELDDEGKLRGVSNNELIGTILCGPMELVQYRATKQGWELIVPDEHCAADEGQDDEALGNALAKLEETEGQLTTITTERDELSSQVEKISTERDELKSNLKAADVSLKSAISKSNDLEDDLSKITTERDELQTSLDTAREDLTTAQTDLDAANKKIEDLEAANLGGKNSTA